MKLILSVVTPDVCSKRGGSVAFVGIDAHIARASQFPLWSPFWFPSRNTFPVVRPVGSRSMGAVSQLEFERWIFSCKIIWWLFPLRLCGELGIRW